MEEHPDVWRRPIRSQTPREPSREQQNPAPAAQTNPEEAEGGDYGGGAFNPETGEINWDCPCLGGMAHGPCGPEFREAFSCFVYSEDEPKGINCVEKFQGMQTCFREHPEVYASEIADDEEAEKELKEGSSDTKDGISLQPDLEKGSTPTADVSAPAPKPSENVGSSEQ
ncbi:hypothetical protein K438DRAFT_1809548 [Mycena galopus ATCC 62051]|nr:hypothetical protein K438DRAFT_1809548 [Mycena galopus ATCC 62051]